MQNMAAQLFGWEIHERDLEILRKSNGQPVELGEGGYGKVYKGSLWNGQFIVAVKEFNAPESGSREDMGKEMELLASIRSGFVTQFIGVCFRPRLRMVMEFLEGGSLYHALRDDSMKLFSWYNRGSRIALEIAQGLFALHRKNIIHFDIKSPNILLAADLTAKICDVGIAKQAMRTSTVGGDRGLSFEWASPEQILGKLCSTQNDIYSYGVVLWEIVTGGKVKRGQLYPAQVPEQCPQEVWELIDQCMDPEPSRRPDAGAIVDFLKELASRGPPKPPAAYCCPLTGALMTDPVRLLSTGGVYERANIRAWFAPRTSGQRRFCPQTREPVRQIRLITQYDLLEAIKSWQQSQDAQPAASSPAPRVQVRPRSPRARRTGTAEGSMSSASSIPAALPSLQVPPPPQALQTPDGPSPASARPVSPTAQPKASSKPPSGQPHAAAGGSSAVQAAAVPGQGSPAGRAGKPGDENPSSSARCEPERSASLLLPHDTVDRMASSSTASNMHTGTSQASAGSFTSWLPQNSSAAQTEAGLEPASSLPPSAQEQQQQHRHHLHNHQHTNSHGHQATEHTDEVPASAASMHQGSRNHVHRRQKSEADWAAENLSSSGRPYLQTPHASWLEDAADSDDAQPGPSLASGQRHEGAEGLGPALSGPAASSRAPSADVSFTPSGGLMQAEGLIRRRTGEQSGITASSRQHSSTSLEATQASSPPSAAAAPTDAPARKSPSPLRVNPRMTTEPSPFAGDMSPGSSSSRSGVQMNHGLPLRASMASAKSPSVSIPAEDLDGILAEMVSQEGPTAPADIVIPVSAAVHPPVRGLARPTQLGAISPPGAVPAQKDMRRRQRQRSPNPPGFRPSSEAPGSKVAAAQPSGGVRSHSVSPERTGQAHPQISGQYSQPRKLSRKLSHSSSQLAQLSNQPSESYQADAYEYNAFAVAEGLESSSDVHNSFGRDSENAFEHGEDAFEDDYSPGHRRRSSHGLGALKRLDAIGGHRRKNVGMTEAEDSRQHPEVHHTPSRESTRTMGFFNAGSRAITPKGSRESQISYTSMKSTDPSSSDIDDLSALSMRGADLPALERRADGQAALLDGQPELDQAGPLRSLSGGSGMQPDQPKASVCTQRDSSEYDRLSAVCDQAIRETTGGVQPLQPSPSGARAKSLGPFSEMLRRLQSHKHSTREKAATEFASKVAASSKVFQHLVEAISEAFPEHAQRASLDMGSLQAACSDVGDEAVLDASRRSQSGGMSLFAGRSKGRLEVSGVRTKQQAFMQTCAGCLLRLLTAGGDPAALAALLLAALARDSHSEWLSVFSTPETLRILSAMLGDPLEQEPACYALMVLSDGITDRDQAKAVIAIIQQNLVRTLKPLRGTEPSLAQDEAARTIAILAQDDTCAAALGRECLEPLFMLLRAAQRRPSCQDAVVQALNRLLRSTSAASYTKIKTVDGIPPLVLLLSNVARSSNVVSIQTHTIQALISIVHDNELCHQAIHAGILASMEPLLRQNNASVQTDACRLLEKLTSHGRSTCPEQLRACALHCLPVLRPLIDDKASEEVGRAANNAVLQLEKHKLINKQDLAQYKVTTHTFTPLFAALKKHWTSASK